MARYYFSGTTLGSILRPILFSVFLIDLLFRIKDFGIVSYTDGNIPYVSANNVDRSFKSLEEASTKLLKWFIYNLIKSNANKCHSLVSANNTVNMRVENFDIKNNDCEKLLGVKFDHKLRSDHYLKLL